MNGGHRSPGRVRPKVWSSPVTDPTEPPVRPENAVQGTVRPRPSASGQLLSRPVAAWVWFLQQQLVKYQEGEVPVRGSCGGALVRRYSWAGGPNAGTGFQIGMIVSGHRPAGTTSWSADDKLVDYGLRGGPGSSAGGAEMSPISSDPFLTRPCLPDRYVTGPLFA